MSGLPAAAHSGCRVFGRRCARSRDEKQQPDVAATARRRECRVAWEADIPPDTCRYPLVSDPMPELGPPPPNSGTSASWAAEGANRAASPVNRWLPMRRSSNVGIRYRGCGTHVALLRGWLPAREPRHFVVDVTVTVRLGGHAPGDDGSDRRAALPAGPCAACKRGGDVVERPDQSHFLLAGQVAAGHRGAGIGGQPIPAGAKRLERLLKARKRVGRGAVASSSFGGAIECLGCLDQRRDGFAQGVWRSHGSEDAPGESSVPWVAITKPLRRIAHPPWCALRRRAGL
jgi:hypothetical protein